MSDLPSLSEMVIECRGPDRSMSQFAAATGISAPTLSRLVNGKHTKPVSTETLKRIYDARAGTADVKFEDMVLANSLIGSEIDFFSKADAETSLLRRTIHYYEASNPKTAALAKTKRHAQNAVTRGLLNRGVTVQWIPRDYDVRREGAPFAFELPCDFSLFRAEENFPLWYFVIICGPLRPRSGEPPFFHRLSRLFVLDAWNPDYFVGQKTSVVFNDEEAFTLFCMHYGAAPLHSAISAILVDLEEEKVLREHWLSGKPNGITAFEKEESGGGVVEHWTIDEEDEEE